MSTAVTPPGTAVGGRPSPADPLRAFTSPATWLGAAHLLLDVLFGIATCFLVLTGVFWSVVLLPFALAGVPVWMLTAWVSTGLGAVERFRYRLLLGVDIEAQPMPPAQRHPLRYAGVLLRDPGIQRRLAHQVLAAPLGMLTSGIVYGLLAVGSTLLVLPVAVLLSGNTDAHLFWIPLGSGTARGLLAGLGLVLLLVTPAVVRGLVAVDVAVARALLGPVPGALAARVGELERSRARVVDSVEAERRRIERDLHDGTQQSLVSLAMTLGRAKARYRTEPDGIGDLLDDAHRQAKDAVVELRGLIRGLHPPVLSDRGLDAALPALASRCPVPVDLVVDVPVRPPLAVESIGYFVVSEALTNVAKHSGASRAGVVVTESDRTLWITVTDNGRGGADAALGTGLRGLADRVSGVDGQLSVDSPVGGPTVLTVELPCRPR
ncbi:sensor domain-containing protein [Pseudonocardia sp. N23]|uniref:sensor histidine kinase n=1 Tax=Pseudonocardia sp. N23 TaxID=1987376 RepID=UPI000BFCFB3E|nr:sensor domain-containing protein [Pseudonocardia sp. N23]GAY10623.1 putative two-component system sensor kinase [Pseudonocardia sp. N23]